MNKKIFLSFAFLCLCLQMHAATIIVQNVNDSGPGSLRTAIANSQDGDLIRFNPNLLNGGNNTLVLSSYLLVNKPITIKGLYNQNDTLYISGNNTTQIMTSVLTTTNSSLILDSLVFINGTSTYFGSAVSYEDVQGSNSLIIRNCLFKDNTGGGTIVCDSDFKPQSITMENSVIRNCAAGIGISSVDSTSLAIMNSEIFDNAGSAIGSTSETKVKIMVEGCSIYNNGGGGIRSAAFIKSSVTVKNSTFYGNSANQGGAVFAHVYNSMSIPSTSSITLTNCTITGNSATYIGGVYSYGLNGSILKVTNCTIVGNTNAGLHSESTGISSEIIKSSIVALNTSWDAGNVSNGTPAPLTSNGYNIFGVVAGGIASDQLNATAAQLNLGPLQLNGGNTKTMLPGAGSIAINMGNPADLSTAQNIPLTDGHRDVGAAEVCATSYGDSTAHVCGTTFDWYGTEYTSSGEYTHNLTNSGGCDSIVTLHLTFGNPSSSIISVTECTAFTWNQNGISYTESGLYMDTIPNSMGCDSVVTLNLTINDSWTDTVTVSSCGPYYWEFANSTHTLSGTYSFSYANAAGCDSTQVLILQIGNVPTANLVDLGNGDLEATTGGNIISWYNCATNTIIPNENAVFTPTQNGTYAVIVYDMVSFCQDTSNCVVINNVSLAPHSKVVLSIYPNPTNEAIIVSFEGKEAQYTIYDAQGKHIQTSTITSGGTVSLRDVEAGVYFFELITAEGKTVKRVVKN